MDLIEQMEQIPKEYFKHIEGTDDFMKLGCNKEMISLGFSHSLTKVNL